MHEAKSSGKPVEVSALTDERTLVTADPATGRFTADMTATVARVRDVKGGWREPSTKLVAGEDGLLRQEATVAQIAVSAGGSKAPLVSFADGESRVEIGWPTQLPAPVVENATATYPEVFPGVDLVVRAEIESAETYLVVKTPEAGKNVKVRNAAFTLSSPGLTAKSLSNGTRSLQDAKGVERLVLPPARMWDSAGAEKGLTRAEDRIAEALDAKSGEVGLQVADGKLTAVADTAFLDDPDTVFPVIIDPAVTTTRTYVVRVTEDFDTINDMTVPGKIGYNGWTSPYYKSRMFYQFRWPLYDGTMIAPEQIVSSKLEYVQIHSPQHDCSDHDFGPATKVEFTNTIDSNTPWAGPAVHPNIGSVSNDYSVGHEDTCSARYRQVFDVTAMSKNERTNYSTRTTVTTRVASTDESDKNGWRHYDNASGTYASPRLIVDYQQAPLAPTNVKAWPLTTGGKVLSPVPLLSGTMRLPAGDSCPALTPNCLVPIFTVTNTATSAVVQTGQGDPVAPDATGHVQLTTALANNTSYRLDLQTKSLTTGFAGPVTAFTFTTDLDATIPSLLKPANLVTTTDTVWLEGVGPAKDGTALPTASVQWRVAGAPDGLAGWVPAPPASVSSIAVTGGTPNVSVTGLFDTADLVGLADGAGVIVPARVASLIEAKVCLAYVAGPLCTPAVQIQKVAHAFGAGFPEADAGPGKVALWTGELSMSDTDAELATPTGDLSIARSHNSFAGPAVGAQNQIFGPGWTPSFDAAGGFSGAELVDGTATDGTLSLVDSDGSTLRWQTSTKKRRSAIALPTTAYTALDKATKTAGVTLTVTNSGNLPSVKITDEDGVETTFVGLAAPTAATDQVVFKATGVKDKVTNETSTLTYTNGKVSAIVAAMPDGVTSCTPGTPTNGCRVLKLSYTAAGLLETVKAQVNTDADRTLASYSYDTDGRLATVTDSRTGLVTSYTYTGTGPDLRLATLTPPGLAPFSFEYSNNKLAKVTRPNPATAGGGTAQIAAFAYNVPLTGTVPNLPNMATEVTKWNQSSKPTQAFAVFSQDQPINGAPGSNDGAWKSADLQLTDNQGYTVNTASYGAGDWQITAAEYDTHDNVVMAWDERAIAAIRSGQVPTADADTVATKTVYDATGMLPTDVYGPIRQAVAANGTLKSLRTHTHTDYDQGAPNSGTNPDTGMAYRLATRVTVTAETVAGAVDATLSRSFNGYAALVAGDATGWDLGQPTSTTVDMDNSGTVNAGDITRKTRYDSRGRIIEQRQPQSAGTDAGTRTTAYYTAAATGASGCTSNPAWAGMTCKVGPASATILPTTTITSFTWDLETAESKETSGSATVTTATSFDAKDRPTTVTTTASGLTGSHDVPAITTSYDNATGLATGTSSTAGSTATTHDNWGRQLTYTNTVGGISDQSTTTHDTSGRVASVVAGPSETKYTYDGTDADSEAERRGLVTRVETRVDGGTWYTSTAAHDQVGALILERLPGQIIRRTQLDNAGSLLGVTINGTVGTTADQAWFGWTSRSNSLGQIVQETGASQPSLGVAVPTTALDYRYDPAGRLTQVNDTRNGQCTVRLYGFDANGNRTSQTSRSAAPTCPTTGGTTTTRAYDAADRPTTGANGAGSYTYDLLGRQTSLPNSDAPTANGGDIALEYDHNDNAHAISQGGTSQTFTLDGAGRRWTQTTTSSTETSTLQRHYTDSGDNPTWTADSRNGTDTSTTYAELASGNLSLTITKISNGTSTAELAISGLRGDINTTVLIATGSEAFNGSAIQPGAIAAWNDYDEYGQPKQTRTTTPGGTTGIGYGWLGQHQRATLDNGLTLMGARIYNPTTAVFTSTDPVEDGGDTTYGYPNDPINKMDLSGEAWDWWAIAEVAVTVAMIFIPGGLAVGLAVRGAMWAYRAYKAYRFFRAVRIARVLRAVRTGKQTYGASRRIVHAAGKRWVGKPRVRTRSTWNGQRFTRYNNPKTGRQYRSPTDKNNPQFKGRFANFDRRKGKSVHVRIV